ncbi:T9SS sorting signal type C domain-containing protein [Flavobacterium sp. RSB2_4_14]|uniref:T9SS sorting signal type C domain-containing protein n=1 Tax=Flavobacterium sp. RSB2_4_14 TaxID=3447665 RepID=UPI003F38A6D5
MKTFLHSSKIVPTLLLLFSLFFNGLIFGQATKTWVPTTGGNWTTAGNWSPSGAPAAGDNVIINSDQSAAITAHPAISLASLTVSGNCNLQSDAPILQTRLITVTGAFSISAGKTLTLGISGTGRTDFTLATTATGTINGTLRQNTSGFVARTIIINGNLTISSAGLITGENTNSNFTLASGATLQIGSADGIATTGATGNVQASGTRTYSAGANYFYNGTAAQVTGSGLTQNTPANLTINNSAGITLSAATTISGLLTMTNGTLNMANANLTVGSLSGSGNITNSSGTAGVRTITIGSDNTSPAAYSGVISNGTATSVGITKTGIGTLTLSGNNTYTGASTLSGGILELGAADRIANTSAFTFSGGTFSTGATTGFSETIGVATLSANSVIDLGTGIHTLTIANSSAATWGAFTLTINNWTGIGGASGGASAGKIQVGTGGLIAGQLAKVQFTGYPIGAVITASGELVPSKIYYYSKGSLAPQTLANWNTKRDGTGTNASGSDFTSGNIFVVQNTHTMTTGAAWSVSGTGSKVQIESGGILVSTSAITLATATTFQIDNGGTYVHNNTSAPSTTIFNGTESFAFNSNVRIDNWQNNTTVITTGVALPFGNLELNWTGNTGNWQQAWTTSFTLCAGDFKVTSVGTGTLRFNANTPSPTITIGGDYIQTAGTVDLSSGSSLTVVNVGGDFSLTGGTLTESGGGNNSTIVFNKSGIQIFTSGGTVSNVINFTVNSGSALQMAAETTIVTGGGTFTLSSGAILGITSANGITTVGNSTGNIRTTTARTFNAAANYIYNGGGAQAAGNALPATIGSLTVNNNTTLTLPSVKAVTNNFSIAAGSFVNLGTFSHTAGTLTLGGFGTPSGSHGSTTSAATNKNNTFFAATIGIITVGTGSCLAISAVISGSATICSGSPTNIQVAITGGSSPFNVVYTSGSVSGYVSGSNISVAPTSSTTYIITSVTDSNGCAGIGSGSAVVTIDSTTSTNGGVTWSNGTPSATKSVVFDGGTGTIGANFAGCSLRLINNAAVTVSSGFDVTLEGRLTVDSGSTFTLNNNANLLQNNTLTNSGNIIVKRNSNPLIRLDYTLWSSPVSGQNLFNFSPLTSVSPNIRFYTYNPTINAPATTGFYQSVAAYAITDFAIGKGYLIRLPFNHPTAATIWNGQFTGVPFNGTPSPSVAISSTGDRFNAVGNPYPSPISISQFATDNSANIETTLYFWRKTNNAANASYCSWNTATSTYSDNGEAYTESPLGVIQTGQGFLVQAKTGASSLVFNNGQRIGDNANQFFRTSVGASINTTSIEANRIWLNMTGATSGFSQSVVGYFTNGTLGLDDTDSRYFNDGPIALTSTIANEDYVIQGRPVPFDATDVVAMKYKVTTAGQYTISIDHVDGLFATGQEIFLRDNLTTTVHNLTAGGYTFTSEAGTFASRFEIIYQGALGVTNPTFNANQVIVYKNEANDFVINSGTVMMASVKVFDIRGRLLLERKGINATETNLTVGMSNEVLLVQITSEDGEVVTKKVLR